MGVLRFLWQRVLAFDRIGSRIPQLVQVWFIELFLVMPLMFFIGKVIDIHGALGVPGTGGPIGGVFWGALVVSLVSGCFFVRSLMKPRVVRGSWTPVVHADIGPATVYGGNRDWTVTYPYLTSHPSYALLLLLTAPIPAVMFAATINQEAGADSGGADVCDRRSTARRTLVETAAHDRRAARRDPR